jgi:hypothetical protein
MGGNRWGGRKEETCKRINAALAVAESCATKCIGMGRGDAITSVHSRCMHLRSKDN